MLYPGFPLFETIVGEDEVEITKIDAPHSDEDIAAVVVNPEDTGNWWE